ncbi:MAG: AAA family ATPase [Micrococcales bacterium]|nr:AAA family ATPase [Micrococcales bacterium]
MAFLARPAPASQRGPGALVALDAGQRAVVDAVVAGRDPAVLALGAPGTGKTTVALEAVVAAGKGGLAPQDVLMLAASRRLAADLRTRLAAR